MDHASSGFDCMLDENFDFQWPTIIFSSNTRNKWTAISLHITSISLQETLLERVESFDRDHYQLDRAVIPNVSTWFQMLILGCVRELGCKIKLL